LAGMMVLALMAALIATGASGRLMTTDAYRSARWLEEAHEALASFTLALVAVHVAAVLLMSAWHGENLVRAMITGGSVWNSQRAPSIRHRSGAVGRRGGHWIESYSASMIVR
jgi:cytochrome b